MTVTLSQKETMLLQDLKSQEQLCIEKYGKYATDASDANLRNLFTQLGQTERQHFDTISQMIGGTVPTMGGGSSSQSAAAPGNQTQMSAGQDKQKDRYLCSDALAMEKHVSSVYDTCIFELRDVNMRNALNHIQKEEQEHGEKIYSYMAQNGMYNVQ
ncbi:MAG: spore coat protein [Oscillospiraceae bacterium]